MFSFGWLLKETCGARFTNKGESNEILLGSFILNRVFPILGVYDVNDFASKSKPDFESK